ncbi:hypothetical protein ACQ3G7_20920 [Kosakonia oryzendophytica]|uniref:hypothetical protein n=1 Tax=Kosakonia oryzendophytica TaxID=1005665 RepID=UPI003D34006B
MSNDVCGYISPSLDLEGENNLDRYKKNQKIGIIEIGKEQLYNFPVGFLPMDGCYAFLIGDRPDYPNATYLIDYLDYAPEADIGFPLSGKERLNILLDVLRDIFIITNAKKMVIALTDGNQIEHTRKIKFSELYDVIHADFELHEAPPDTLYEITL